MILRKLVLCLVACLIVCPAFASDVPEIRFHETKVCGSVTGPLGNTIAVNPDNCGRGQTQTQAPTPSIAPAFEPSASSDWSTLDTVLVVVGGVVGAAVGVAYQWKSTEGSKPVTL